MPQDTPPDSQRPRPEGPPDERRAPGRRLPHWLLLEVVDKVDLDRLLCGRREMEAREGDQAAARSWRAGSNRRASDEHVFPARTVGSITDAFEDEPGSGQRCLDL